jgi:hypothetical protein
MRAKLNWLNPIKVVSYHPISIERRMKNSESQMSDWYRDKNLLDYWSEKKRTRQFPQDMTRVVLHARCSNY